VEIKAVKQDQSASETDLKSFSLILCIMKNICLHFMLCKYFAANQWSLQAEMSILLG
jgi:hypothetical protein